MTLELVVDNIPTEYHCHCVVDFPTHKMSNRDIRVWRNEVYKALAVYLTEWLDKVFANIVAEV